MDNAVFNDNELHIKEVHEIIDDPDVKHYELENDVEMVILLKQVKEKKITEKFIINAPDEYYTQLDCGCDLFEACKYTEAIVAYSYAMTINPVAITARFEICECLIHLEKYDEAQKWLLDSAEYFIDAPDAAKFYRRLGYIFTEQKKYQLAIACNLFSLNFERNENYVKNELMYIIKQSGRPIVVDDPEQYLKDNGVPMLVAYQIENKNHWISGRKKINKIE